MNIEITELETELCDYNLLMLLMLQVEKEYFCHIINNLKKNSSNLNIRNIICILMIQLSSLFNSELTGEKAKIVET